MADVRPFICCLPQASLAHQVAALPYDVFSRAEAAAQIAQHPLSFLRIDKSCALLPPEVDQYHPQVYQTASQLFTQDLQQGIYQPQPQPHYYLYRLIQNGHAQTGIVACIAVADLKANILKRHENTRHLKLEDRTQHILALHAQTGPVFVTYPTQPQLSATVQQTCTTTPPLFDFTTPDNVQHTAWCINDKSAEDTIRTSFLNTEGLYIADGHHRAAAAEIALERANNQGDNQSGEADYFLIVAFPSDEVQILDYNRVVFDTNGLSPQDLLARAAECFDVTPIEGIPADGTPPKPGRKGEFALYVDGQWYQLVVHEGLRSADPVEGLDVSLLHNLLLEPVLGIDDPRSSERIAYVGGSRGLIELKNRIDERESGLAVALYPCSLEELFAVADAGRLMPPKSTWFEPKPRSGLFIHQI